MWCDFWCLLVHKHPASTRSQRGQEKEMGARQPSLAAPQGQCRERVVLSPNAEKKVGWICAACLSYLIQSASSLGKALSDLCGVSAVHIIYNNPTPVLYLWLQHQDKIPYSLLWLGEQRKRCMALTMLRTLTALHLDNFYNQCSCFRASICHLQGSGRNTFPADAQLAQCILVFFRLPLKHQGLATAEGRTQDDMDQGIEYEGWKGPQEVI
ncbi:unnamed protein product [Eretmochelys imbricata]